MIKKKMFSQALVEMEFKTAVFKLSKWNGTLTSTYIRKIKKPYMRPLLMPCLRLDALLVKKETVTGIMGNTHGVSRAIKPPRKPMKKIASKLPFTSVELP